MREKKEYNNQSVFVRSSFVVDSTTIIRNNPCVDLKAVLTISHEVFC